MRRSKQSLSGYNLLTCDMGQVVPVCLRPVLPGDLISHQTNMFMRVTPMAAPVMHQVDARIHHFYVANRTIWDDWEDFITGGEDGMNADVVPTYTTTGNSKDLWDYFGVPPVASIGLNALPIIAFNRIWNEFYRDQDLQIARADDDVTIPKCAWGRDYLNTARPWSSKGPQVSIPVGDKAYVKTDWQASQNNTMSSDTGGNHYSTDVSTQAAQFRLYADLQTAEGADPIDVRTAWGMQRFMEEAARFGSRYPEKMRRLGSQYQGLLERPEFLGGGSQAINFSEVLQTANDTNDRPFGVGDLYGHGIAATRTNRYKRRIDEHGYVISLLSVRPTSLYQDGVEREWLRSDREDFHDPFLEDVGMMPVYNGEVDLGHAAGHKEIFGYQDRYDDYRQGRNQVTAEFRDVLDYWHLGRQLTDPMLNGSFVECTPSKRIFNEQTMDSLWIMCHNKINAFRNIGKRARTRLI
ncbi:major capsid protein [Microviridae sp.]|nr:major capsid protein [Microviridae sp.]